MDIKILSANEAAGYDQSSGIYTGGAVPPEGVNTEESVRNWTAKGGQDPLTNARKVGRFIILGELGRGGMGEVLKAMDPLNGNIVALKILDEEALKDRETLIRFEREANAAADLDHPNIAKLQGMHYDEEGRPFLVMEFVDGTPLDRVIRERLDLLFSQMLDWIIQVARGLEFARRRGIIHRDIKPANIIIDSDNAVRIIDFGLAKSMWDTTGVTGTGMVVGTPRYMSPEQGMGRNVDHRSDIYALGATLYELVTKQTPFDGDTPMSIMMKHINSPLTPPYVLHPKCPSDVNEITVRMLAKDPGERYQDYEPLIHDLESARIHRLAKERAYESHNPDDLHGSATMVELEPGRPSYSSGISSGTGTTSGKRPNPYLSEGLVKLDMSDIPDVDDSPRSPLMTIMIGVVGLAVVGFLAWRQTNNPNTQGGNPGWLSRALTGVFGNARSDSASAEEIVKQDEQRIATTLSRIDGLKFSVSRYRRSNGGEVPSTDLERSGLVSEPALLQDAWGNRFTVRKEASDVVILAAGRDGLSGTSDDFRVALESSQRKVPAPLRLEDVSANQVSGGAPASQK